MLERRDTTRTGEQREVIYWAGVRWIRIKCGVLFQGHDGTRKETNSDNLDCGVSFLQPSWYLQRKTGPPKQPPDRAALRWKRKGPGRMKREPADNSPVFMRAR